MPLLLLLACPTTGALSPEAQVLTYDFAVRGDFSTRSAALGEVDDATLCLRGALERSPSRIFRDGSVGTLLRFVGVEQAGSEAGPWTRSGLDGRTVELRLFENGEILGVDELEHIAGSGRHGEVFDVLLPALSPVVPRLGPGETGLRRSSWPTLLTKEVGWRTRHTATWERVGTESGTAGLRYQGPLEGKGGDERFEAGFEVSGETSGELWVRTSNGLLVRHDFDWTRTVEAHYASGAELTQVQAFTGSLSLSEEAP